MGTIIHNDIVYGGGSEYELPVASADELGGILYTNNTKRSGIDLATDGEMKIRDPRVYGLGVSDSPYNTSGFIPLVNSISLSSGLSLQSSTVKIAISNSWVSSNFDTSSKNNLIASMKKFVLLGLRFDTPDIRTVGFCDWGVDWNSQYIVFNCMINNMYGTFTVQNLMVLGFRPCGGY